MPDFELEETESGLIKPGTLFSVKPGTYIYFGGLTPESSSLRVDGWFEVVERVADSVEPAWWCRMNQPGPINRFQICVREADILAYCTPAKPG